MHFRLAYLKLTLSYVLIVMIISISFSVVIYKISSNEIQRGLTRQNWVIRGIPLNTRMPLVLDELERIRIEQMEESNNRLKNNLFYFNLLILILSTTASYFLAKKTLKPIKEAMEAQSRFTADASHELRTPLTAMRSEIEVGLRDNKINLEESKKLLESNLEEISKLESLSSALLKLAKYQEELRKEFTRINLEEIIIEAYGKIEHLAKRKNIVFDNELKEINIKGDKQSLTELFIILLDNAIKYSPQNSKISINMKDSDKFAQVDIIDYGIGIKASDLPYIFNRFYRADHSRNKELNPPAGGDGYGLGLAIAKSITDLHGGTVNVISKIGMGSDFKVRIPNPPAGGLSYFSG